MKQLPAEIDCAPFYFSVLHFRPAHPLLLPGLLMPNASTCAPGNWSQLGWSYPVCYSPGEASTWLCVFRKVVLKTLLANPKALLSQQPCGFASLAAAEEMLWVKRRWCSDPTWPHSQEQVSTSAFPQQHHDAPHRNIREKYGQEQSLKHTRSKSSSTKMGSCSSVLHLRHHDPKRPFPCGWASKERGGSRGWLNITLTWRMRDLGSFNLRKGLRKAILTPLPSIKDI